MPQGTENVDVKLPSGEVITAIVPQGMSDADIHSLLMQKHPEYFPKPDTSIIGRAIQGFKSQVPAMSGNAYDPTEEAARYAAGEGMPSWASLKAAFKASPVGQAVQGNWAGAAGGTTAQALMALLAGKAASKSAEFSGKPTGVPQGPVTEQGAPPQVQPSSAPQSAVKSIVTNPAVQKAAIDAVMPYHLKKGIEFVNAVKGAMGQPAESESPQVPTSQPAQGTESKAAYGATLREGKTPAQAEARFGVDTWAKMVQGRDVVTPAVEATKAPEAVQEAAKNVAGAAIGAGDVEHAVNIINAAASLPGGAKGLLDIARAIPVSPKGPESMPPIDFQSSLKSTNPSAVQGKSPAKLTWEDILDDKAWKERFEQDYGTDMGPAPAKNWANTFESQQAAALERMVPLSRMGRAIQTEQVKQFIENNRIEEAKSTLEELTNMGQLLKRPQVKKQQ